MKLEDWERMDAYDAFKCYNGLEAKVDELEERLKGGWKAGDPLFPLVVIFGDAGCEAYNDNATPKKVKDAGGMIVKYSFESNRNREAFLNGLKECYDNLGYGEFEALTEECSDFKKFYKAAE